MTEGDRIRETYRAYEADGRSRLWDLSNRGYARLSRDRDRQLARLLSLSLPTGPARLLDVGSGDGSLVADVIAARPDVAAFGLDLLADRVELAQAAVPSARFVVGSADELPFESHDFDVVTAITLFSSIPGTQMELAAASEIGRVLRPGGWLIWYDLRYDNPWNRAVHGLSAKRLRELFPGWPVELRSFTVAPPIARRLGRLTPAAYPVLHAIPPLRSHLIGRLRCPS